MLSLFFLSDALTVEFGRALDKREEEEDEEMKEEEEEATSSWNCRSASMPNSSSNTAEEKLDVGKDDDEEEEVGKLGDVVAINAAVGNAFDKDASDSVIVRAVNATAVVDAVAATGTVSSTDEAILRCFTFFKAPPPPSWRRE